MSFWDKFKKKQPDAEIEAENIGNENVDVENVDVENVAVENVDAENVTAENVDAEKISEDDLSEATQVSEVIQSDISGEDNQQAVNFEAESVISENIIGENSVGRDVTGSDTTEETQESAEATEEEEEHGVSLWTRLKQGLAKTRNNIVASMDNIFSNSDKIDDDFYEELEEIMILGDIGVRTTDNILEKLKQQVKAQHIKSPAECKSLLIQNIKDEMHSEETTYRFESEQAVVFVIGVNGVGKTTTIGKMASLLKSSGRKVMLCAADTFRAAANSQLEEWSHRAGVPMIGGVEGQDPSSVLFDAVNAAKARNIDVLLVDTAGRLHNKKNLMDELGKMNKIIDKAYPDAYRENLIVLDASTGQNALNQAKEFGEVANLTGIVLTKMDGSAKGGVAIAISSELGIPVKYVGVGEKIVDLQKFEANVFVDALFASEAENVNTEN